MIKLRSFLNISLRVLREIFDESAYERFLARTRLPAGRGSYAAFLEEQQAFKARRPRCC